MDFPDGSTYILNRKLLSLVAAAAYEISEDREVGNRAKARAPSSEKENAAEEDRKSNRKRKRTSALTLTTVKRGERTKRTSTATRGGVRIQSAFEREEAGSACGCELGQGGKEKED